MPILVGGEAVRARAVGTLRGVAGVAAAGPVIPDAEPMQPGPRVAVAPGARRGARLGLGLLGTADPAVIKSKVAKLFGSC